MNRKTYASILALIFLAVVFLPGCNNSSSKPPAQSIAVSTGSPQSATVDVAFAAPLVAVVTAGGAPVSGVSVTFTAPAFTVPATVASGTFASNSTQTETDVTNANGLATSSMFTANTFAGAYTVTATIPGVAQGANFSLTNVAVTPTSITATSGGGQSAFVLTAFANPLVATVLGANSVPAPGVSVVFTAPASGVSGTFANGTNTETDMTNASGVATSSVFTANGLVGGPYDVTAAVTGVTPSATFEETNTVGGTAVGITALSGTPQSAVVSTAFAAPLVATVTTGGVATQGASVTFTAPTTGQSGTFASTSTNTETDTTDVNGNATSSVFTANATTGSYVVAATVAKAATPANFNLTNTTAPTSFSYVFYLSGLEVTNPVPVGPNFYTLAGSVTIGTDGTVTAGEQDYNDGDGNTSPNEPTPDTITSGTLTVSATTGQGTLTLVTNNPNVGVAGTETLGVQFVNANHALIVQFDGSATSSGSLDLQTPSSGTNTDYAFTYSGTDTGYNPEVFGGIFSVSSNAVSGVYDVDDNGTKTLDTPFTGTSTAPDAFGRGTVTGTPLATTLVYYTVGPEVMRFIGVDPDLGDAGVGSAFGQGASAGAFSNASLATSIFGIQANAWGFPYAAAGVLTTTGNGSFGGIGDANEEGVVNDDVSLAGSVYSILPSGYGTATTSLDGIVNLGIYMTDPQLNLNDPNNTAIGSAIGGGLIVDLDSGLLGTGVLTPQTDPATTSFTGPYAFGGQDFNPFGEFDFVGQGAVASLALTGTGLVSDPFTFFTGDATFNTAVPFAGTATPDGVTAGRYTIPLLISVPGATAFTENAVIYQASGGQLIWVGVDATTDLFLGPIEQQGSLTGLPAAKKAVAKTTKKK